MREFFWAWRRKIGVVTLVMACVFAAGWLRSCDPNTVEEIWLVVGPDDDWTEISIESGNQKLGVLYLKNKSLGWGAPRFGWSTYSVSPEATVWTELLGWKWNCTGFGIADYMGTELLFIKGVAAPYWFIVIPLTLLSAFLLLKQPHKSNQERIGEPIPIEGGAAS